MAASARLRAFFSMFAVAGVTWSAVAQSAPPATPTAAAPETRPSVLSPAAAAPTTAAPAAPRRSRAISPEVAAQLSANTPKYNPPPPKAEPKPEDQVDLREVDKPRNRIIRLDPYIVQESKPPVFTERTISTPEGLADIAMRRYITDFDRAMNRVALPLFGESNANRALTMYAEDERLQNMASLADSANNVSKSDPAAGEYVRREAQKTYMRTSDFGRNGESSRSWHSEAGAAIRATSTHSGQR